MPALNLSDKAIQNLAAPEKQTDFYDSGRGAVAGLILKASPGGSRTFYLLWRPKGKRGTRQHKLGRYPALTLAAAREKARKLQVALQDDPDFFAKHKEAEEQKVRQTFTVVVEQFRKRYVEREGLRTGTVMMQQIAKHLTPKFKDRDFSSIRRSEIAAQLDKVEDKHGAAMADSVLSIYRSLAKFYALRNDSYNSPIIAGMKRYKSKPRERVLSDVEIRAFWNATAKLGIFGGLARICLLTGQRRAKVNFMKRSDIQDGVWVLGHEPKEKPNCGQLKLVPLVLSIIDSQPRLDRNPYVFPGTRLGGPFSGWGQSSKDLLKLMRDEIEGMPHFTLHDLRRTFRSRCSKLGIPREIAERCLGHVVGNAVERTYDQYRYEPEMTAAFAAVAAHIADVVSPPPGSNVVRMSAVRAH